MKITHPVKGFSGYARTADYGLHFLAGVAYDKASNIPDKLRKQMESDGFEFTDDRRTKPDPDEPPAE